MKLERDEGAGSYIRVGAVKKIWLQPFPADLAELIHANIADLEPAVRD